MTGNLPSVLWIALGIALVVSEFFLPVLVLIFFGFGAVATGLVALGGWPADWTGQAALFAGSSLALMVTLRRFARRVFKGLTADTADAEPGFEDFIGKEALVITPFTSAQSKGRVAFRGTEWEAECFDPLDAGARVLIVERRGQLLVVRKISP